MAKVKIQGHASGTGVLTVTAPNTSTDRTITLPDATATIATTTDVAARLPSITDGGNANAITIDSSENVGIGVTPAMASASYNGLHIGATYPTMKLSSTSSGHAAADGFHLRIDSTPRVEYWNYENTDQVFANNNGVKLRLLAGGGLCFGTDTAAANALDDYEEGTWTPSISTTSGGSSMTYSSGTAGGYVKIGSVVFIWGMMQLTDKGNLQAGTVFLKGFPFNMANTYPNNGAGATITEYGNIGTFNSPVLGYTTTERMFIRKTPADGSDGYQQLNGNDFVNNSYFRFYGQYTV